MWGIHEGNIPQTSVWGTFLTSLIIKFVSLLGGDGMIIEYIEAALEKARYDMIQDEEPFYAEVPGLEGVYATGKTLEECRKNLAEVIDGWIVVRLRRGLPIPPINGHRIEELKELKISG